MPTDDAPFLDASDLLLCIDGKTIGKVNCLSTVKINTEADQEPTPPPKLPVNLSCKCRPVLSKGNADGCNNCKHLCYEVSRDPNKLFRFYCGVRVYRPCPGRQFKFYLSQSKPPCTKYEPYKD